MKAAIATNDRNRRSKEKAFEYAGEEVKGSNEIATVFQILCVVDSQNQYAIKVAADNTMKSAMIVSAGISRRQAEISGQPSSELDWPHANEGIDLFRHSHRSETAAIALPTRPANMVAANTGPSSRTNDMLMTPPSFSSIPIVLN